MCTPSLALACIRPFVLGAALAAAACASAPAFAQTPADVERAARESQRIIQEEQQREQQRRREIDEKLRAPKGQDLTPKPAPPAPARGERCFQINAVELEGATRLSKEDRDALTRPVLGRCVGLEEINEVIQAITNLYVSRGFTTTRAYIPEQDMTSGRLRILVLEGVVEKINLKGGGLSLATAFPDLEGRVFNLRDFEQGLDQANRLRSNSATMDIQPGSAPGASVVEITNQPAKPWSLSLGLDNTGSVPTGRQQASATFGYDNLLGLTDYLNVSYRQNPDAVTGRRLSRSTSLLYAVPYGPWLATVSLSEFEFASIVHGQFFDFQSSGVTRTRSGRLERMAYRDQHVKLTLATELVGKSIRSSLNGEPIAANSRDLSIWNGAANLTLNAWGTLWSLDAGFAHGLDAFGALEDPSGLPDAAPRAQYTKLTYGASASRPFKIGETAFSVQSSLVGQYARNVLYGSEQIAIGGPYSVRGFRTVSISGDTGFYWRNELSMPLALSQLFGEGAPAGSLRPYIAYDVGHIEEKHGVPGGTLAGGTIGFYFSMAPSFSMQLGYSRPQKWPGRMRVDETFTFVRMALDF